MSLSLVTGTARVVDGRLRIHNRRLFDEAVRTYLRDGWEVELEITRLRATRSQKQNGYYFGVVLAMLSEYTGHSVDTLHDLLKVKFLSRTEVVLDANGDVLDKIILGTSTRRLKTVEFARYVDDIRQWAALKLHLDIPDPDPSWRTPAPEESLDEPGYGAGV